MAQQSAAQDIDVAGGTQRVLSFGTGQSHALAVHGITASAMCWPAVARALPAHWTLHAVDLRGRGHSTDLTGPYGLDAHIADLRDIVLALGLERPVLVGHSLGAYVALLTAHAHPELFERLVLIDGGLPVPLPPEADADEVMKATLGPAIARLSQTYPTADAYVQFWQAHPAMAEWNSDLEDYVRYDLRGKPGALRSRANPEAVRADSRELLTSYDRIAAALRGLPGPTSLLRAPAGMFGQPPGLLPEELTAYWQAEAPALRVTTIPGSNHYTIICAPPAAAAVAQQIAAPEATCAPGLC